MRRECSVSINTYRPAKKRNHYNRNNCKLSTSSFATHNSAHMQLYTKPSLSTRGAHTLFTNQRRKPPLCCKCKLSTPSVSTHNIAHEELLKCSVSARIVLTHASRDVLAQFTVPHFSPQFPTEHASNSLHVAVIPLKVQTAALAEPTRAKQASCIKMDLFTIILNINIRLYL